MRRALTICVAALALATHATVKAADPVPPARTTTTPVIVWSARHGFAWRDALVGAAAALGLALAVQGLVAPSIRRRRR
jgi:hypothetical protein